MKKYSMRRSWMCGVGIIISALITVACNTQQTSTGGNGGDSSGSDLTTDCGVIIGDSVENPVSTNDGIQIFVQQVSGTNQLIYTEATDTQAIPRLLKLQGISGATEANRGYALNFLKGLASGTLFFFPAGDNCQATVEGGGAATVGTVLTRDGRSINEELARTGLVTLEIADSCGADKIASCFAALDSSTTSTAGEITAFLWKPVSDSNGKLAVHTGPYNSIVIVNGETGFNQGSGNGFGSLARFSKPGCSYGAANVKVLDGNSGLPYTLNGSTTLSIPNGCQRTCLTGGALVACTKS